jgi:hypothetical protein
MVTNVSTPKSLSEIESSRLSVCKAAHHVFILVDGTLHRPGDLKRLSAHYAIFSIKRWFRRRRHPSPASPHPPPRHSECRKAVLNFLPMFRRVMVDFLKANIRK